MPRSLAIETTSRLVDVPIVVDMPPIRMAALTGISVCEAGIPPCCASCTRIGNNSTSTGVSLTTMLIAAASASVTNNPSQRLTRQTRVSTHAAGSSAPVTTSPRPRIINAQIVIKAWWPKPPKANASPSLGAVPGSGNRNRPSAMAPMVSNDTISIRTRPLAKPANVAIASNNAPAA